MTNELQRKTDICSRAENAEWIEVVASLEQLDAASRTYMKEHPPGLVNALWHHFEATRNRCGCSTEMHERPECTVRLIERLLLDDEHA